MQMDKKPHLDFLQTLSKSSLIANLYGKLFAVKDMQIYLVQEEIKVKKEIEENESNV